MSEAEAETVTLSDLIEREGVTIRAKRREPTDEERITPGIARYNDTGRRFYTVTLTAPNGASITTPYHQGSLITEEPTASAVLSCLLMDASGVEDAQSFEEWATDLGFDEDSRRAFRAWEQIERTVAPLRALLGDQYEAFTNAANEE